MPLGRGRHGSAERELRGFPAAPAHFNRPAKRVGGMAASRQSSPGRGGGAAPSPAAPAPLLAPRCYKMGVRQVKWRRELCAGSDCSTVPLTGLICISVNEFAMLFNLFT